MPQPIIVVGSSNTDMVIKAAKFPLPGETILGGEFFLFPGGKGANQAVAAARLGGNVIFIAKVGNDIFGEQALQQFKREGIITDYVAKDPDLPSGVALITVDSKGENTIVVAQGSNGALSPEDVKKAEHEFEKAEIVLTQLETPLPTILHVAKLARKTGKKMILNPAPAMSLPEDLFPYLYLITPNETETETLTGIKIKDQASMKHAAEKLKDKGVTNVIITLGSEGVYLHDTAGGRHIPTRKVKVVDSTAAGDVFNGALAVALSENRTLEQAAEFANHAAAISVTKMGAQASAPYRKELTNNLMKHILTIAIIFSTGLFTLAQEKTVKTPDLTGTITLTKEVLKDKIKGGWAGQTVGVTFGGPTEFRFCGTMIQEYVPIKWYDGYLKHTMENNAGLYDDIYMDLTFVDVFEKHGLDAPVDEFAQAYAKADYMLWHANQAGRYNILHGIKAPQSGHWLNNPHADCIDYQIESDFAGLMSPGMPNTASEISDKIGHIMNYGDGWYGGIYVGAMYTLAFTSSDINYVVSEALKTIPSQSRFYKVINDVIQWNKAYPNDWKRTWFEIEKKWTEDVGCPDGVFVPFNIDATVNAAYVVLGLLYGNGDFTKTMDITTRAGQDSDCNPSSAGGILGAIIGYDKIPAYWKMGLGEAEPIDFKYTTMSLNDVYDIGFKHALQVIAKNGGKIDANAVTIKLQQPKPVRFEQSFEGHHPIEKKSINKILTDEYQFEIDGIGFVVLGESAKWDSKSTYVANAELYIDNKLVEKVELPTSYTTRRYELFWKYQLPKQKHSIRLKIVNPDEKYPIRISNIITYSDTPAVTANK